MKKLIFSILCCTLFSGAALSQVPNPGFENWTNTGVYEVPDMWGTMNNATSPLGIFTATKATPAPAGSYYLKLTSKTYSSSVVNGIAVSGKLDSLSMQPISGFAYNQQPQSLIGKWQHMIYGTSQGSVSAMLTKWNTVSNSRDTIAIANHILTGMAMSWANFSINFVYQSSSLPDSCIIVLKASGSIPTNNDYLWVDGLAFSGSVAGIQTNSILNGMNVYPNPSNGQLVLDLSFKSAEHTSFELTDIYGKLIRSFDAGILNGETKQTLDISNVASGTYFIRVITEKGREVKKIVIE